MTPGKWALLLLIWLLLTTLFSLPGLLYFYYAERLAQYSRDVNAYWSQRGWGYQHTAPANTYRIGGVCWIVFIVFSMVQSLIKALR